MNHQPFTGMGNNPEGPDLPIGFGMLLSQEPDAIANYGKLTTQQQSAVIEYIQGGATGGEAQSRIMQAIKSLRDDDAASLMGKG